VQTVNDSFHEFVKMVEKSKPESIFRWKVKQWRLLMDTPLSAAFWVFIVTQYYANMENNKHM